jgi:hypothetical protein
MKIYQKNRDYCFCFRVNCDVFHGSVCDQALQYYAFFDKFLNSNEIIYNKF